MPRRRFYVGPQWPIKLGDYDYLRAVGEPDWAWEFLRRNPLYQRDQRLYQLFFERPFPHARGLLLTRTRRRCHRAEAWHLCSFVDPNLPVLNAPVTWLPSCNLPRMRGRADRLGATGDADFRVDALSALASIHIDAFGRQHVVLKSANNHVTVSIRGAAVAVAPARVTFEMTGLADLFAAQRNIALLQELVEAGSANPSAWSVTGLEKRDALIALDAHCNGASHRDVAILIFGPERVQAEWIADGCDLKDYVRRCRSRALRYMQGGYRRLLR